MEYVKDLRHGCGKGERSEVDEYLSWKNLLKGGSVLGGISGTDFLVSALGLTQPKAGRGIVLPSVFIHSTVTTISLLTLAHGSENETSQWTEPYPSFQYFCSLGNLLQSVLSSVFSQSISKRGRLHFFLRFKCGISCWSGSRGLSFCCYRIPCYGMNLVTIRFSSLWLKEANDSGSSSSAKPAREMESLSPHVRSIISQRERY